MGDGLFYQVTSGKMNFKLYQGSFRLDIGKNLFIYWKSCQTLVEAAQERDGFMISGGRGVDVAE